ncbi:MAG: hypothetical protein STHCBS139747_003916 [Sporothrix thermara]
MQQDQQMEDQSMNHQSTEPVPTDVDPEPSVTDAPPLPPSQTPSYSRYTHQFSAASSRAILQRLRAPTTSSPSPTTETAEEAATRIANQTMPMPVKDSDDTDSDTASPAPTQPVCSVCAHPARSVLNPLVQCVRCARRWHRLCHEPVIADHIAAAAAAAAAMTANGTHGVDDMDGVDASDNDTSSSTDPSTTASTLTPTPNSNSSITSHLGWSCPACAAAATAAAAARFAHRARTQNRTADALYVPPLPAPKTHNLAAQTSRQRRQYLSGLPQRELAHWLAYALDTHADLAVYPPKAVRPPPPSAAAASANVPTRLPPLPGAGGGPGGIRLTAAQVVAAARNPTYRNGIINSIRKSHAASLEREKERERERERAAMEAAGIVPPKPRGRPPRPRNLTPTTDETEARSNTSARLSRPSVVDPNHIPSFVATPVDPDEEDPTGIMAGWPKPGQGLYAEVGPDWDMQVGEDGDDSMSGAVLVERGDHASFSSVVYNAVGQKVQENGLPVLRVR